MKLRNMVVGAALAVAAIAAPAQAVIVSGTLSGGNALTLDHGSFVVINGGTVGLNAFNTANTYGLNEAQKLVLASSVAVDLGASPIAAGTYVSSHLILVDPARIGSTTTSVGSVTFGARILGLIFVRDRLVSTNAVFNNGSTTYGTMQGTEGADTFSYSGKTFNYSFFNGAATTDMVRVITAVPEPQTWAMLVVGFGLVGVSARRRKAAVAA
jgi:hypothetical protein